MFGFGAKKTPAPPGGDRSKLVGLDLDRVPRLAAAVVAGRPRPVPLAGDADDLPLVLALDRRPPAVGTPGVQLVRKRPHLTCSTFLPLLGQPRQWQAGRLTVTPEDALTAAFEAIRGPLAAETENVGLALPAYLSAAQAKAVNKLAAAAKLPVRGSVTTLLAVAAHRAAAVLAESAPPPTEADGSRPDWVVKMRTPATGPASVVVVDVDEFALSAAVVGVDPGEVKQLTAASWPRASAKAWADRLIDTLADRCVRLCRRDPRDSADAEQTLYEQLGPALDRVRAGLPVTLTVRGNHWYQDLVLQPEDVDVFCAPLAQVGAEGLEHLLRGANLPVPPRAVWLTHTAARLPGLLRELRLTTPEQTEVIPLPPTAVAEAAAALVPRWMTGLLPRTHLDGAIPLDHGPVKGSARDLKSQKQK
ncbi:MAG: hypothetical protein U0871_25795 [Gemmataceae bacterium]